MDNGATKSSQNVTKKARGKKEKSRNGQDTSKTQPTEEIEQ